MNETELLQKLIPYRMQAVDTLNYALRLRSSWSNAPWMTMHVDGKRSWKGTQRIPRSRDRGRSGA